MLCFLAKAGEKMLKSKRGLSSEALKITALILMVFNHFCVAYSDFGGNHSYLFAEGHWYLTRGSFIIYAFLIGEGMIHTRDRKKYLMRLGLFAVISELPFDLCFYMQPFYISSQNVFFTLFLGALAIYFIDLLRGDVPGQIAVFIVCALAAESISSDYGYLGIAVIVSFYVLRGNKARQLILTGVIFCIVTYFSYFTDYLKVQPLRPVLQNISLVNYYAFTEMHGLTALPLIALYNGKRSGHRFKLLFYAAYPVHLLVIWCIFAF